MGFAGARYPIYSYLEDLAMTLRYVDICGENKHDDRFRPLRIGLV